MILPIVFTFLGSFFILISTIAIHSLIGTILYEEGNDYVSTIKPGAFSEIRIIERVNDSVAKDYIENFSVFVWPLTKGDEVTIEATYKINGMYLKNRFYSKCFTGYEKSIEESVEYVYVTEDSNVYHSSLNCKSLKSSIRGVSFEDIEKERNEDSKKYYPCSKCGYEEHRAVAYVTPYGRKYHFRTDCPNLKITVYKIPKEEIGDRRKCSFCE